MSTKFEEMEARYMLEELGYELYIETSTKIEYRNTLNKGNVYISSIKEEHNNDALPKTIIFWKYLKCVDFEYGRKGSYLYLELLQAINKQIEELGWNNEI